MTFTPDDDLLAELRATFAVEAAEHVASLNNGLLALERASTDHERQDLLKEIFRNAHSLKGGAAIVGMQGLRDLAHHLESMFGRIQRGGSSLDADMFDTIYKAVDIVQRIVQHGEDAPGLSDETAAIISRLGVGQDDRSATPATMPSDIPAGVIPTIDARAEGAKSQSELAAPSALPGTTRPSLPEDTVRIATSKLDDLMNQVGEVIVATRGAQRTAAYVSELEEELQGLVIQASDAGDIARRDDQNVAAMLDRVERLRTWLTTDTRRMSQVTSNLQEDIRRARMLPVSTVFDTFPRMVRDLARSQGKRVRLEVRGGETEVDRAVIEQIKSPLTHLLRNSIDHGLEGPEARIANGKSPEGTIVLSASQGGDTVTIEVVDDGAGIDVERVKAAAIEKGGVRAEDAGEMERREALSLIFRSGLSTSGFITTVSGRGIGLDVVRENVERLHGTIEVDTDLGRGTSFSLILPLTVATTRCVIVRSGGQTFAVPLTHVLRTLRLSRGDVRHAEGQAAIVLPEGPLPMRDLASVLGLESEGWLDDVLKPSLVARCGEGSVALLVDEVLGVEEAVVKNLPRPFLRVRHVTGGSVLGSGDAIIVLNVADVVRSALRSHETGGASSRRPEVAENTLQQKILLADDSITTRTLEKNILQSAGYDVRVAVDGSTAWSVLQEDPPDLVVSDVEMPGMDGFALTTKIRSDDRLQYLPVVLVTSLESDADRQRGIEVGADAYIGKSSFDQEHLLDVIRRLI